MQLNTDIRYTVSIVGTNAPKEIYSKQFNFATPIYTDFPLSGCANLVCSSSLSTIDVIVTYNLRTYLGTAEVFDVLYDITCSNGYESSNSIQISVKLSIREVQACVISS